MIVIAVATIQADKAKPTATVGIHLKDNQNRDILAGVDIEIGEIGEYEVQWRVLSYEIGLWNKDGDE